MAKYHDSKDEELELDQLIDKFKNDDKYFAHIQRKAVTRILSKNTKNRRISAEDRLINIVINNRY
ncbi:hypothetical protein OAS25_06565 [Alphaproteobacteria bacterium]|nr:hypothetical protein [Alphaproteobacteria bacterium]